MSVTLAAVNAVVWFLIVIIELRCYKALSNTSYRWIKVLYAFVGLYWSAIYTYIAFNDPLENAGAFGQIFIRPAFTFTGAVILAGAIFRLRSALRGGKQ